MEVGLSLQCLFCHIKGDDSAHESLESSEEAHPTSSPEVSSESESSTTFTSSASSIDLDAFLGPERRIQSGSLTTYKIVGDNIDKEIKPRHMRSDNQARSLHYFHSYAVRDRVNLDSYDDSTSAPDPSVIDLESLLPSPEDTEEIRHNMAILVARTLKKYIPYFLQYGKGVERHITHEFYEEMTQKSDVVSCICYMTCICV